ncbi:GNAT family N-acetyltransferase [Catelliglobosispora koreensis]|uniref:GNAT family N-acetyltransferase n=1 Tax=Catelliglobosispora koreensis TaxID=129052 RepID=UPI0003A7F156|nr:GNAT family N-acetyltransferase [Catelliglobosispora koreensis]
MLGNSDLGARVVVRRRVFADGRSKFTDLLGVLTELTESYLTVATLRGEIRVPLDEIHRAKRVPDVAGLERAAALAMPAPDTAHLGDWLLRAAEGFTGRANSVLPLGDPGMPFSSALAQVEEFYASRGLPPWIDVPLPLMRPVARALETNGWKPLCTVLVRVIEMPALLAATPPGEGVTFYTEPTPEMRSMIKGRRGGFPASAAHVLSAVPLLTYGGYSVSSHVVAMARGTVTNGWLGYTFVETDPAARRRGLAREVMGAVARWGAENGARRAFLQVQDDNTAALALYDSMGFQPHHWYTRYSKP